MESIEKLRGLKTYGSVKVDGDLTTTNMLMACATMGEINEIADEIEREIAEKYMELPVDADGVPIRAGENLRSAYSKTEYTALGFWFDFDCGIWQVMVSSKHAMSGNILRHVKPDQVSELLNGLLEEYDASTRPDEEIIAKYAAKIREAVSADE